MPRLFTGLEIPSATTQHLALLRGGLPGARFVEPSDYHITLRFIGDIDPRLADEVADLLARVQGRPFRLRLAGLDTFGKDKPTNLHVLVEPSRALSDLQADHERLMQKLGLAPEARRYTPHVTLARLAPGTKAKTVADWIVPRLPFATEPFEVGRFVLFSARASVGGGPYVVEDVYPLVAA